MARKPTYNDLVRKVEALEKQGQERAKAEEALRETARRLELAYDQAILYAQRLKKEIIERKETEKALEEARNALEKRVAERTAELSAANAVLKKEIVERKKAEAALREGEFRLKTVLDTIQAGIVVIDPEIHVIVGINAAAGKMIGAARGDILGRVCHQYICPAAPGQCPATDLEQDLENAEMLLVTAKGETLPILKTVVPVILEGRAHLLESFLDITDLKRAEAGMRESERQAYLHQKRTEMLRFANDVALKMMHELRNPLLAVGGFSRRIAEGRCSEDKLERYTRIIAEQSKKLDDAVDEVLMHLDAAAKEM